MRLKNNIEISKIKTDLMTCPSKEKLEAYRKEYEETGHIHGEIVLTHENQIVDGYISFLILKEAGFLEVPVVYKCKDIFITASHPNEAGHKVRTWRVTNETKNPELLVKGGYALVDTSRGQAGVEIVDVICSNKASKYRVSRDVISGLLILPEEK